MKNYQWWGETSQGIEKSIQLAQAKNLKVMIKPQLWLMQDWIGNYKINSDREKEEFIRSYEDYILKFAHLAEKYQVEMFCIATEFKQPLKDHPGLLNALIKKIRKVYHGKIIYAANWDNYQNISVWDQVDYIGINAYFPLSEKIHPSITELKSEWERILSEVETFACKLNKDVWLTEYGYLSVDGGSRKNLDT